jgi:predicted kinase
MNIPKLILTCGVQGSGKSTWARKYASENPDILYLSTDKLRSEMGYGEEDQSVNKLIYARMSQKTESALRKGQSVLLDATFIKPDWRKEYVELGRKFGAKLIAHVFNANRDVLIERVKQRVDSGGLTIPTNVIDRYINMFEPPTIGEFDEIVKH